MGSTKEIKVSPVYADPRGKVGRDGSQEHLFNVRRGSFVDHVRAGSREAAEKLRAAYPVSA